MSRFLQFNSILLSSVILLGCNSSGGNLLNATNTNSTNTNNNSQNTGNNTGNNGSDNNGSNNGNGNNNGGGTGNAGNNTGNNGGSSNTNIPQPKCLAAVGSALPKVAGLPQVSSGQRPGPAVLYDLFDNPPTSPMLQNHDPRFVATPILVQGHEAYVNGEYLYQDYIYDDYGSDVSNDDLNESGITIANNDINGLEPRVGDIDYPTNFTRYGGNAADLVEFRISHGVSDVAYRITLNTLLEEDSTIIAIVFDMDNNDATGLTDLQILPRDPGASFEGADEVLFLWGSGAEHVSFATTGNTTTPLNITTKLDANQMWVTVPRSLHNPTGDVGITVAAGLYDTSTGGWLMPQSAPTATQPGTVKDGSIFDPNPAGIFNLAFRFDEPVTGQNTPPDTFQSDYIRQKEPTHYEHVINYDDLANGVNRNTVPATGQQMRLFASSFSLNEDGTRSTNNTGEGRNLALNDPTYLGPLQPYSIYIPTAATGNDPLPLHWAFHSNAQQHWQYNGANYVQQIGEDVNAYVATTLGRGPRNWYDGPAELDAFEVWADIARNFNIDGNRTATTGYSMGGFASYRFGTLYPDLFGKAFTQVGPPGELIWVPPSAPTGGASTLTNHVLENVRNLPYMNIAAVQDELVPYPGPQAQNTGNPGLGIIGLQDLDYRYRFLSFNTAEHYTLFLIDDYPMATEFMADTQVDRNPYHVTFSYLPAEDDANFGIKHDHAYWVSKLTLADSSEETSKGTIDAFSHACGLGDPSGTPGADAGANPLTYNEVNNTWGDAPAITTENRLTVKLTNLASVEVDLLRTGLDLTAAASLLLTADTNGTLTLTGNFATNTQVTQNGNAVSAAVTANTITLPYTAGAATYMIQ